MKQNENQLQYQALHKNTDNQKRITLHFRQLKIKRRNQLKQPHPLQISFGGRGGSDVSHIKKKKKGIYGRPVYERKPNVLQRKTLALMS